MKNHFEVIGDSVKVYSNGKHKELSFVVDASDLPLIENHSWRAYISKSGYIRVETSLSQNGKIVHLMLSRFLMNFPKGKFVDHIDCNPLNNRRSNLRLANESQNARNVPKTKRITYSRFKGVSWHKHKSKWVAHCAINSKNQFIGYFTNEEDAARAYDLKAKELHGAFAKLNFPD